MWLSFTTCKKCGKTFLQHPEEGRSICRICYGDWKRERERIREDDKRRKWQEQHARDQKKFETEITKFDSVSIENIKSSDRTLYILGNGFDLMHRVQSSYYSFRDSLGKHNRLREALETALTPKDIWADFETSLGELNLDLMCGNDVLDTWLGICGFFDDDAGDAEFYMAAESAVDPLTCITDRLQPAFRRWVSALSIVTDDRPLKQLINSEGRCLNFNYTEFAETMYGLRDTCYIHGCRKNKTGKLILGHKPEIENACFEEERRSHGFHRVAVQLAQDVAFDLVGQYDKDITKNSREIIDNHRDFFDGLRDVDQIIVIGHSLSSVDRDYFCEVKHAAPMAQWLFGVYGLNDLHNLEELVEELKLQKYCVFRTDDICTKPVKHIDASLPVLPGPIQKIFREGETIVTVTQDYIFAIGKTLELVLPSQVKRMVFLGDHLLVILNDLDCSVLLFGRENDNWSFVDQLKGFEHQGLINRRLNHVFLTDATITFVYNNRVRKYDLKTGAMIINQQVREARNRKYSGVDVSEKIIDSVRT